MFNRGDSPCRTCHLWACKCDQAECDTPEPQSIEDFTLKTHTDLARLVRECKVARRLIAHIPCGDRGACKHCATIRDRHRLINDHLDQLETATLEAAYGEPA